jgi:hypothetical protein
MAQNNGDVTARVPRGDDIYIFLKGNSAKKIYVDISVALSDKRPSYCTVENWVTGFRTRHVSTETETFWESNSSDSCRKRGCHSFHDPGRSKNKSKVKSGAIPVPGRGVIWSLGMLRIPIGSQMAVRFSALRAGRALPPEISAGTHLC